MTRASSQLAFHRARKIWCASRHVGMLALSRVCYGERRLQQLVQPVPTERRLLHGGWLTDWAHRRWSSCSISSPRSACSGAGATTPAAAMGVVAGL